MSLQKFPKSAVKIAKTRLRTHRDLLLAHRARVVHIKATDAFIVIYPSLHNLADNVKGTQSLIQALNPDQICVEMCDERFAYMKNKFLGDMLHAIHGGGCILPTDIIKELERQDGNETGIAKQRYGLDMVSAILEGRRHRVPVFAIDRKESATLSRLRAAVPNSAMFFLLQPRLAWKVGMWRLKRARLGYAKVAYEMIRSLHPAYASTFSMPIGRTHVAWADVDEFFQYFCHMPRVWRVELFKFCNFLGDQAFISWDTLQLALNCWFCHVERSVTASSNLIIWQNSHKNENQRVSKEESIYDIQARSDYERNHIMAENIFHWTSPSSREKSLFDVGPRRGPLVFAVVGDTHADEIIGLIQNLEFGVASAFREHGDSGWKQIFTLPDLFVNLSSNGRFLSGQSQWPWKKLIALAFVGVGSVNLPTRHTYVDIPDSPKPEMIRASRSEPILPSQTACVVHNSHVIDPGFSLGSVGHDWGRCGGACRHHRSGDCQRGMHCPDCHAEGCTQKRKKKGKQQRDREQREAASRSEH